MSTKIVVSVDLDGRPVEAGTLFIDDLHATTSTFSYSPGFLDDPRRYDLDPSLPRVAGTG